MRTFFKWCYFVTENEMGIYARFSVFKHCCCFLMFDMCECKRAHADRNTAKMPVMAILVVEFQIQRYKISKHFILHEKIIKCS